MAGGQPHTKRDVGGQSDKSSKNEKSKAPAKTPAAAGGKPSKATPKPR